MIHFLNVGEAIVHLDTFMRQNIAAAAQLLEMFGKGVELHKFGADESPEELEDQDPAYLQFVRAILVGPFRLEPILVCGFAQFGTSVIFPFVTAE
jgi:hypothetical protein